jgi:hypothetical protein
MQIQPVHNPQQINSILQIINSPQFTEGIFLVRRKGAKSNAYDHYGVAVSGKYLKNFSLLGQKVKVIHRIHEFDTKVIEEDYNPFTWQTVHKMPESEIPLAILRTYLTQYDKYNLLFDNCEHFARFITTGKKESSQVQNVFGLVILGSLAYFALRDDN